MVKTQNKQVQKQSQAQKGGSCKKLPEVEDFFTNFLSKKVRNITKKLGHIQELEKKIKQSGEELKKDQLDMISRREELEKAVEENNAIKKIYLEAHSKRAENEPAKKEDEGVEENKEAVVAEEDKSDREVVVPQIDVEAIREEAEAKGVNKTCTIVSKLLLSSYLLRTQDFCDQFAYISGIDNLETLNEFMTELNQANGDNLNQQVMVQKRLEDLVNGSPVMGTETKTNEFITELVNTVVDNSNFASFVPQVKEIVVVREISPEPEIAICNMNTIVNENVTEEEEVFKTKSRRESEIQQKIFMEEDSEDEQFEVQQEEPAMKTENQIIESKTLSKPQEKQVLQEQAIANNKPVEQPKKSNDEDDDDWVEVKRGNNYYNRDNQRGGRGRGGRGNRGGFRGGRDYKGEKKDYKDGEKREFKDGERKEFKDGEKRERKPWTNKDGENRENRGGRGRGGRGGRGRFNKDGEKRVFNKTNIDGERVEAEEQPRLKEVGTLDRGNEQPAQVQHSE